MAGTIHKEIRPLVRQLEAQGGHGETTRRGHLAFYGPDGRLLGFDSGTPNRPSRARNRVRTLLRRAGLAVT